MTTNPRSGLRIALTPAATSFNASMSSPESVSSRIASLGSSSAIWKISLRFFSPPENPSLTARLSSLTGKPFQRRVDHRVIGCLESEWDALIQFLQHPLAVNVPSSIRNRNAGPRRRCPHGEGSHDTPERDDESHCGSDRVHKHHHG